MKPREMTQETWDVNRAIYGPSGGTEARVYSSCTGVELTSRSRYGRATVVLKKAQFDKLIDFVASLGTNVKLEWDWCILSDDKEQIESGVGCGVGVFDKNSKTRWRRITPRVVVLVDKSDGLIKDTEFVYYRRVCEFSLHLSQFRKIIKWYNADI